MTQQGSASLNFVLRNGRKVAARRYVNPDGTIGGLVAETAVVESGAVIEVGAVVGPGARVSKGIRVKSEKIVDIQDIE
ncbi:hypothetical protein ACFSQQ_39850 [Mesorhizobium kowhaii]|uniref:hypothetical protein n=1 Tax=Mesorhizobium kowhaii TaxID=1300272 RepID=UPI0035EF4CBF